MSSQYKATLKRYFKDCGAAIQKPELREMCASAVRRAAAN